MNTYFSFSYFSCCLLYLHVFLALFHLCLSDHVSCTDGERQALLLFKHDLVDEKNRLDSWVGEDTDCCKWTGIGCDNSTGRVHEIRLRGVEFNYHRGQEYIEASKWRLKGDISPSLLNLKELKHLDLSCNDFRGAQIPKFIGSLQNLRYLNLSYSNFFGVIPPQLGNLSKLRVLGLGSGEFGLRGGDDYIRYSSMKNMQWLSSLGKLHHLNMDGMNFDKESDWLQVINTLPSLVQLHLPNCLLPNTRLHVSSLNLSSLTLLDLSFSSFDSSLVPWIFSITSLVSLDLSGGFFKGIPSSVHSFRNLTSLEFLNFGGNDFEGSSLVLKELSNSKIISLDISLCDVSSSLLDSLVNLTALLSLDLSSNQLTKIIPKSLGNHCNLRMVDLSYNNMGNMSLAYLLESFLECKSPALESLSLSKNNIKGIIPHSIGQLSFLRILNLGANEISGVIPYSIGQLSSLEGLYLQYNQLNGSLPDSIGRLSSLRKFDLSYNQLDGSLPYSLGQLSKLDYLDFSYNLLMGIVTEAHFVNLVSLNYLDATHNNLTFRLQVANWTCPFRLEYLSLKSWVLGPQFPLWFQSQKNLKELDISHTHISSAMPESFVRSFPNLRYFNISHNHIRGMLPPGIPTTLEVVDLSHNEFSGSVNHLLCSNGVKDTSQLILGNNHLSGFIPECWGEWQNLAVLSLENNSFSGRLPTSLKNLTGLQVLQLNKNELFGKIPTWIGTKLTLLILVNLRSNNFDGSIPHELCYLTGVRILDLAHNNLFGNVPRCFNNLSVLSGLRTPFPITFGYQPFTSYDSLFNEEQEDTYSNINGLMKTLDFSSNNLVGSIPSGITFLVGLQSLNLSRNQLTGRIPKYIGDIKELVSFDLSFNMLSGELPVSLSVLNFLSTFNVSYNMLTGSIPQSTQIQSFNESSFFGNKLCGAPLTKTKDCVTGEAPRDTIGEKHEDDGRDWGLVISIMIGFASGFWIIWAPLIMSISWRITYFSFLNKLRYMVYDIIHKYCFQMFRSN